MADGEENNLPQTKTILIPREKLCRKCSAQLFPVFPEIKMGEKILYDCGGCGEREYRQNGCKKQENFMKDSEFKKLTRIIDANADAEDRIQKT